MNRLGDPMHQGWTGAFVPPERGLEAWARQTNVDRFRRDLRRETDPDRRRRLEEFILQEQARLAEIVAQGRAGIFEDPPGDDRSAQASSSG
jgi:hypothetical protein